MGGPPKPSRSPATQVGFLAAPLKAHWSKSRFDHWQHAAACLTARLERPKSRQQAAQLCIAQLAPGNVGAERVSEEVLHAVLLGALAALVALPFQVRDVLVGAVSMSGSTR